MLNDNDRVIFEKIKNKNNLKKEYKLKKEKFLKSPTKELFEELKGLNLKIGRCVGETLYQLNEYDEKIVNKKNEELKALRKQCKEIESKNNFKEALESLEDVYIEIGIKEATIWLWCI